VEVPKDAVGGGDMNYSVASGSVGKVTSSATGNDTAGKAFQRTERLAKDGGVSLREPRSSRRLSIKGVLGRSARFIRPSVGSTPPQTKRLE